MLSRPLDKLNIEESGQFFLPSVSRKKRGAFRPRHGNNQCVNSRNGDSPPPHPTVGLSRFEVKPIIGGLKLVKILQIAAREVKFLANG